MADNTPLLGLPYILAAQAQKHVTHNEALRLLDGIVQLSVKDRNLNTPPGSPVDGDRYLVAAGASGDWTGWSGDVAMFADGSWWRLPARTGWLCYVEDEDVLLVRRGASWELLVSEAITEEQLGDGSITLVGVNTGADATNRLAVKSDAVLLSHDDVTPGSGDMRVAVNKKETVKDAAFVFQTNWSTRALFGLLGADDFGIKVSPDGSTFHEALVVDKGSGQVSLPQAAKFSAYMVWGGPDQWIGADGWTKVGFNNTRHNDQSAFDTSDFAFVAPADGYYLFGAMVKFRSDGTDPALIEMGLSVDFAVPSSDTLVQADPALAHDNTILQVTGLLKLNAGQKVYVLVYFTGQDGYILDNQNYFWGHRVP